MNSLFRTDLLANVNNDEADTIIKLKEKENQLKNEKI